ncbi:MAG: STAS domain-containing protein [Planctomycetota bacterium]|jgi:anti-anti-sigma regulatory factor
MSDGEFPHLELTEGRLTALSELPYHGREFERACRQLLDSEAAELVIDLTRLEYVASPQIGALAATCRKATDAGRPLRVLIGPALERFLGRMRVDGFLDYEVVSE